MKDFITCMEIYPADFFGHESYNEHFNTNFSEACALAHAKTTPYQ